MVLIHNRKIHFWRLSFLSMIFILAVLFSLWNGPYEKKATMMSTSMGEMMTSMHVTNITIYDLLALNENNMQASGQTPQQMNQAQQLSGIHLWTVNTTAVIFLLLPFVIGGTIILTILWIR